jgi:FkbM family methyltransferase
LGQDEWVHKNHPKIGTFIDVGASDGVTLSNTLGLEQIGWSGVCVECDIRVITELRSARKSVIEKAAWSSSGVELSFAQHEDQMLSGVGDGNAVVESISLNDVCDMVGDVDYISLDTEGSEREILSTFDWERAVKLWTVEHNNRSDDLNWMVNEFMRRGYLVRVYEWDLLARLDVGGGW